MRKILLFIVLIFTVLIMTGCKESSEDKGNDNIFNIYSLAVNAEETELTYDEWIESIKGPQGESGKEVLLQIADGHIQWQYVGDATWTNLVELVSLIGPPGINGTNGTDGATGTAGTDGADGLDGTDGTNGTNGTDGEEVILQVAEGFIQWQYIGESSWTNLIEIASLIGDNGRGINSTEISQTGELIINLMMTHLKI